MFLLGLKPILGMGLPFLPVPSLPESLFKSSQLLIYYHRSYITGKACTGGRMPRVSAIRTALLLRAASAVDALWWALVWVALCLLPWVLPCASPPGLFASDLLIFSGPCPIRPSPTPTPIPASQEESMCTLMSGHFSLHTESMTRCPP